jgi:alpha-glucosidase
MSRTGLPIVRPLFLEFPNAAKDLHPIDLDAPAEFLFGPDILVAPPPYPDEVDNYEVQLPPGVWYNYFTGERIDRSQAVQSKDLEQKTGVLGVVSVFKPLIVQPTLSALPVYVKGGAILPIQPLTQSTMETPSGPLTLRVYPGEDCKGTLYQDDGNSYDFKQGNFLRMESNCSVENNALHVTVGPHRGNYKAWWSQITLDVYGWPGAELHAVVGDQKLNATRNSSTQSWQITIPDDGKGTTVTFE